MLDRRELMKRAGLAALVTGLGSAKAFALDSVTLPFDNGERPLLKYPQKRPMIGQTQRPPQLETPFSIFNEGAITPNNAFFVRYHLADVPYNIDPDKFTLEVKGKVDQSAQTVAEGYPETQGGRDRRRQSVLRQQPGLLQPSRRRRSARQWRDGQRALARRAVEGRARHGRRAAGRQASHVQRHGRPGQRQDARFHQGARYRSRKRTAK